MLVHTARTPPVLTDTAAVAAACFPYMQVHYASVSAHADAKGILQLIQQVSPAAVMLVHGEPDKMAFMQAKVQNSLGIKCFMPAISEEIEIDSKGVTLVPTAQQLLRRLPVSVQQLQDRWQQQQGEGVQGIAQQQPPSQQQSGASIAATAADWLQQGDLQQLVGAAMKLAGLGGTPGSSAAAASSLSATSEQQQQLHVSAAAKAAQLAPWLELLAAAAQEVQQDHRQQQLTTVAAALGHATPQGPAVASLSSNMATMSKQLHQQITLESYGTVLDGVLVVKHLPPKLPADQPLVQSMQLLPASVAAAELGLQQHRVKQTCRIKIPTACYKGWQKNTLQQGPVERQQQQASGQTDADAVQQVHGKGISAADATALIACALRAGLPTPLSQQVVLQDSVVQLRSIVFKPSDAAATADGALVMVCSWQLHDDALAQQCVSLIRLASAAVS